MSVKAIIFDVDGTLSETEEAHREAFNKTFVEFDLPWVWSQELYCELLKTTGGKERITEYLVNHLNETADQNQIAEIHMRKTAIYGELIAGGAAALRPGIAALIEDAAKNGVRVAVATTTNRPNVDRLSEACFGKDADIVFEVIAAGDEVKNKKPASDVFDRAVRGLGLDPSECVGLEDSRNGLLSCNGASVPCVVSPGVYTLGSDFSEAAAVIDCFTEIDTVEKLNNLLGG
ncbi:MAG: HAD-IA family hydrolase [Paracoccaceae bacterium]